MTALGVTDVRVAIIVKSLRKNMYTKRQKIPTPNAVVDRFPKAIMTRPNTTAKSQLLTAS
jgi:hypothetical protein